MSSERLGLLITFILLIVLSYFFIKLKSLKYAYNILIVIINIWCISLFSYLTIKTEYNNSFVLFILILSFIFHFENYFPKNKIGKSFSTGIIWFFTIISCLSCFSGLGAIILFFIQPISYLFGFYLLKNGNEKISIPLYINLIISWGFLALSASWILTHY
jgi:hypothetical protein